MRGTGSITTRFLAVAFATAIAAGITTSVWPQSPPSRVGANEPESVQEQGESAQHVFPPLVVDSRIYDLGDPWLSKLADDIATAPRPSWNAEPTIGSIPGFSPSNTWFRADGGTVPARPSRP